MGSNLFVTGHHFLAFFFFLGKKLWVIYVNVIKDIFLLLSQLGPCIQLKEL